MIGHNEIKAFELETDPTKLCLVQTFFYRINKTCSKERCIPNAVHMNGRCQQHA